MIITLKNKDTLIVDNFRLKCCIGKSGLKKNKIEGDGSTPVGTFSFGKLYSGRIFAVLESAPHGLALPSSYLVGLYHLPSLGYARIDISTEFSVGFKREVELPCNSATTPNGTE